MDEFALDLMEFVSLACNSEEEFQRHMINIGTDFYNEFAVRKKTIY